MATIAPAAFSVAHRDALDEVVTIRFAPADPIGMTEVNVAGDPSPARLLALLDAACERLSVYVHAYRDAMARDAAEDAA